MRYSKRLELFEKLKNEYIGYLTTTLWKLTCDTDIFDEAIQYALSGYLDESRKADRPAGRGIYLSNSVVRQLKGVAKSHRQKRPDTKCDPDRPPCIPKKPSMRKH